MIRRPSGVHTGNQSWPGSTRQARERRAPQVPDPEVVLLIEAGERDARPVGREARMSRRRAAARRWAPLCPCDRPTRACARSPRSLRARPRTRASRRRQRRSRAVPVRLCGEPRQHRHGRSMRLQPIQIEGDRTQRPRRDVDQVAASHVVTVAPAAHQHFLRPGAQVAHGHLGRIEPARLRRDREEDGVAAGQDFRPEVVGFALRAVGPRQHLRCPPGGRHALQPRRRVGGREDDRVVGRPRRAARSVGSRRASVIGGPPVIATFLQRDDAVDEADPLAIRRDERRPQGSGRWRSPPVRARRARGRRAACRCCRRRRRASRRGRGPGRDRCRSIVRAAGPEGVMVVRVTRGGAAGRHGAHSTSTSASPRCERADDGPRQRAPPTAAGHAGRAGAPAASGAPLSRSSICTRASPIACNRRLGSFSRQRRSSRRSGGGRVGRQRRPVRVRLQHRRQHVRDRLALERAPAREHLEEHAAERPDVGALVDRLARAPAPAPCRPRCRGSRRRRSSSPASVIVGDVGERSIGRGVGSIAFARPKSSTFTVPSGAHLDVRRLQIAMDDALLVRRFERVGDLPRDRQRLVERDRSAARSAPRASALDQLHHERAHAAGLFEAVNVRDVADD